MTRAIAAKIAGAILADVTGRHGWDAQWDSFDDDVKKEIVDGWIEIIVDGSSDE
jgi:hypothetical protein